MRLGYVGLLTGAKKGGFSITVDTRFDNEYYSGLIAWLKGNHTANFLTFTTRSVMEGMTTYDQALQTLNTIDMVRKKEKRKKGKKKKGGGG